MSQKRETLYATNSAPTSSTSVYPSSSNTHIDQFTVCNQTGSPIDITVEINNGSVDCAVYGAKAIAANSQESLGLMVNHGLSPGHTIKIMASAANLEVVISGRDF